MKLRMLDFLVCPIDKSRLELVEWESSRATLSIDALSRVKRQGLDPELFSKEIISGALVNRARKILYPIHRGIPRMLVFPTGIANHFTKTHAKRLARELPEFTTPHETPTPGEDTVLRTFSSEWMNYDWNDRAYWNISPDAMYKSINFMLGLGQKPVKDKLVLEVGVGIGGIADYMARAEQCELIGIDLSHAVDPAYKHFGKNPFLHLAQASAFVPPFRVNTFDLAYSWGVLHHTYSTKVAFTKISSLPKTGGRLYIWVYSPYDEQRNLTRRILMLVEKVIRPVCWRLPETLQMLMLLPIVPLYLIHQNLDLKSNGPHFIKYGWREAMHAARDRFTPRYAHRHSEEEVYSWFCDAGYEKIQCGSKRERPDFVPKSFVFATAVDGVRR